jgi:hypothetical protein
MKWAMLVVSDVFTRTLPSGLMPMPSGSTPTGISVTTRPAAMSSTDTMLSFSLETYRVLPSGLRVNSSGSGPLGRVRVTVSDPKSSTSIWSASLVQM